MIDESLKNKIKKAIEEKNIDKFQSLVKQKELLDEIRKNEEWKEKFQKQLDNWLEEKGRYCNEKWETYGDFLLECGASKEKAIKLSIERNNLESFKYLIEENKDKKELEKLRQDKEWNKKVQNQLNVWLEEQIIKNNERGGVYGILLECGANKGIIYKYLKKTIEDDDFSKFYFFVEELKKYGINLEQIKKDKQLKEKLQKQLDSWLEEECGNQEYMYNDILNIVFLLECGADKGIIYKQITKTMEKKDFDGFEFYIKELKDYGINLENIKKDKRLNKKIQTQLASWLEEKYDCYSDNEDINFLLECGADKGIFYKCLKKTIEENEKNDFSKFYFFVKNFKESGIYLEEIRKDEKWNKKFQDKIDKWLEEKCQEHKKDEIILLLECGADKGIIYKYLKKTIEDDDFSKFYFFVGGLKKYGINLEQIKKNQQLKEKLQKQLDSWLENIYKKDFDEDGIEKEIDNSYLPDFTADLDGNIDRILTDDDNIGYENIIVYDDEECDDDERRFDSNKIFLLKCGARKEEAIKLSIENSHFKAFKNLVEEDKKLLEDLRKEKDWNDKIKKQLCSWLEELYYDINIWSLKEELDYKYVIKGNINFLIQAGASEEEVLNNSIKQFNRTIFRNIIRRNILSRENIKGLKINNEVLIKELIEYIYEENGLESRTLENKIMKPEKFDEETKKLIIKIVSKTHPERANILKIRLNLE